MPQENGWATGPEYCDNDGRVCPYCGSENTDSGSLDTQAGQVVESGCECLDCRKTFGNLYNIAGWYDESEELHGDLRDFNNREHVKTLRYSLEKAKNALNAATCYFDKQDDPVVVHRVEEALEEANIALEDTKEGA